VRGRVESYLAEVLEDDGDVHVNDDEEADDEIGDQVDSVSEWPGRHDEIGDQVDSVSE